MRISEAQLRRMVRQAINEMPSKNIEPKVEYPDWLDKKIQTVHGEPGQGSIFTNPGSVKEKVMDLIKKNKDKIDSIATGDGTLKASVPGIGYDLVLDKEEAEKLPDAEPTEVEKQEGPNKIKVPGVKTSKPLSSFEKADQLTVIIRPKKDDAGKILPNEYIILSAFPGKDLPRASEWGDKYAVVIPGQTGTKKESSSRDGNVLIERWQKLAGILTD